MNNGFYYKGFFYLSFAYSLLILLSVEKPVLMSESEDPTTKEHALDAILLSSWVNIPKCIVEALQLFIQQIKTTQTQLANMSENHFVTFRQFEIQFTNFAKKTEANAQEMLLNFELLKDTVNRTLKNTTQEVNEINALALEDRGNIQELDKFTQNLEQNIKELQEKFNGYEDRETSLKQLNNVAEELHKKIDKKESGLKELFNNKITEVLDIPSLMGPGKRYSNMKNLVKHIHDNYDKRSEAMMKIIDHKDEFFKSNIAEMDLPNKVKSMIQGEIKQSIMKEVFVRIEMAAEKNKNELVKTLSQEKKLNIMNDPTQAGGTSSSEENFKNVNMNMISQMEATIRSLQERVYLLEHPEYVYFLYYF